MERIGEYLVKRLVGEGGMGKVYEAEERLTGRRVALKVLRPELTRDDEGRRSLLTEMQILARLEHPSLVRSLASLEVDGDLVLVLEYLHGRTLRTELARRGALPWPEAVGYAVKIAEALAVAHGDGAEAGAVVHRDLKPENVMLVTPEDAPDAAPSGLKVMDFGVAKVLAGRAGPSTQSIGTLQYMSPEQIDAGPVDARTDLYALGLVLYEMCAGHPPFRSPSPRELLNLQCTAEPPPLPPEVRRGMPRGVEELLSALLAKTPEARPRSARDVLERLEPFRPAEDAPVAASRAPLTATQPSPEPVAAAEAIAAPSSKAEGRPSTSPGSERLDTVALVAKNAAKRREVATWKAVAIIAVASLGAGLGTYGLRVKAGAAPAATATATAFTRAPSGP